MFEQECRRMLEQFNHNCFTAWEQGQRLAPTIKGHCLKYFTFEPKAYKVFDKLPDTKTKTAAQAMYHAAIFACHEQFAIYTEEQADAVFSDWIKAGRP